MNSIRNLFRGTVKETAEKRKISIVSHNELSVFFLFPFLFHQVPVILVKGSN